MAAIIARCSTSVLDTECADTKYDSQRSILLQTLVDPVQRAICEYFSDVFVVVTNVKNSGSFFLGNIAR